MNDTKQHRHGQEGTHYACQEMTEKHWEKVSCCACDGHQCKPNGNTESVQANQINPHLKHGTWTQDENLHFICECGESVHDWKPEQTTRNRVDKKQPPEQCKPNGNNVNQNGNTEQSALARCSHCEQSETTELPQVTKPFNAEKMVAQVNKINEPVTEWEEQFDKVYNNDSQVGVKRYQRVKNFIRKLIKDREIIAVLNEDLRIRKELEKYTCDFNWDFETDKPKHKSYIALDDVLSILSQEDTGGEA